MPVRAAALARILALLVPLAAEAFQEPSFLDAPPTALGEGGGGRHFTGSALARGFSCAVCHQGDVGSIQIAVTTTPPELQSGTFTPGAVYSLEVRLVGEHHGLDHPTRNCSNLGSGATCNWNGFAAELSNPQGQPAGALCPDALPDGTCDANGRAVLSGDHTQVYGNPSQFGGDTDWTFTWQAPISTQPVVLNIAMVDGDGGGPALGGVAPRDGTAPDIEGDAVGTWSLTALAAGTHPPRSCGSPGLAPCGLIAWLAVGRSRRRRR